jgi:hypothetical protein
MARAKIGREEDGSNRGQAGSLRDPQLVPRFLAQSPAREVYR